MTATGFRRSTRRENEIWLTHRYVRRSGCHTEGARPEGYGRAFCTMILTDMGRRPSSSNAQACGAVQGSSPLPVLMFASRMRASLLVSQWQKSAGRGWARQETEREDAGCRATATHTLASRLRRGRLGHLQSDIGHIVHQALPPMPKALCRPSGTTLDTCTPRGGPPRVSLCREAPRVVGLTLAPLTECAG